ncbi:hypothetical protein BdWA1_003259 [Babesia duncani]|uniref:Uncharacterized protein n=1 Tax=Babesia duncani TaxID=323732 RepID=A0AAD9UNB3_9APIC|nr:hypothetical protein BdWA1_003259 [Babesia duncani]
MLPASAIKGRPLTFVNLGNLQQVTQCKLQSNIFFAVLQWMVTLKNTIENGETNPLENKRQWMAFLKCSSPNDDDEITNCYDLFHSLESARENFGIILTNHSLALDHGLVSKFYPVPTFTEMKRDICTAVNLLAAYLENIKRIEELNQVNKNSEAIKFIKAWIGVKELNESKILWYGANILKDFWSASPKAKGLANLINSKLEMYYSPANKEFKDVFSWLIRFKNTMASFESVISDGWCATLGIEQVKISERGKLFFDILQTCKESLDAVLGHIKKREKFKCSLHSSYVLEDLHLALISLQSYLKDLSNESQVDDAFLLNLKQWYFIEIDNFDEIYNLLINLVSLKVEIPPFLDDVDNWLKQLPAPPTGFRKILEWMIKLKNTIEGVETDIFDRKYAWSVFLQDASDHVDTFYDFFAYIAELNNSITKCMLSAKADSYTRTFLLVPEYSLCKWNILKAILGLRYYCKKIKAIDLAHVLDFLTVDYESPYCRNHNMLVRLVKGFPDDILSLERSPSDVISMARTDSRILLDLKTHFIRLRRHANISVGFCEADCMEKCEAGYAGFGEEYKLKGKCLESVLIWLVTLFNTVEESNHDSSTSVEMWIRFLKEDRMLQERLDVLARHFKTLGSCLRLLLQQLNNVLEFKDVAMTFLAKPRIHHVKKDLVSALNKMYVFLIQLQNSNVENLPLFLQQHYFINPNLKATFQSHGTAVLAVEACEDLCLILKDINSNGVIAKTRRGTRYPSKALRATCIFFLVILIAATFTVWFLQAYKII